ncbi:hypothetical protein AB1Y20_003621 [Prymnesium parvum]|uniref:Uncharacterized protein n=1 Tax=Prymnesium parvum TaxID=97485 RepID=A0AB34J4D8_PRYPA
MLPLYGRWCCGGGCCSRYGCDCCDGGWWALLVQLLLELWLLMCLIMQWQSAPLVQLLVGLLVRRRLRLLLRWVLQVHQRLLVWRMLCLLMWWQWVILVWVCLLGCSWCVLLLQWRLLVWW